MRVYIAEALVRSSDFCLTVTVVKARWGLGVVVVGGWKAGERGWGEVADCRGRRGDGWDRCYEAAEARGD